MQQIEGITSVDLNAKTIMQENVKVNLPTNEALQKIETTDFQSEKQNLISQGVDVSVIEQYENENIGWHFDGWNYRILFEVSELVDKFYDLIPYAKDIETLKEQTVGITGKQRYLYVKEEFNQSHYDFLVGHGKEIEVNPALPETHEINII
jgi:hypothetical protein